MDKKPIKEDGKAMKRETGKQRVIEETETSLLAKKKQRKEKDKGEKRNVK